MITLIKVIVESVRQALQELFGNKLRTFLSLLGITIGIFCIIGVQAAVDSLEDNVRGSFEKLGSDIVYVNRYSWMSDPSNWWKYRKRPAPTFGDYEVVKTKIKNADLVAFHVDLGYRTVKYKSNSIERAELIGVSYEYSEMFNLPFEKGRYFSSSEYFYGANKIIIGYQVAEELFGTIEPIGKKIKIRGKSYDVIGVIEKAGDDLINIKDYDDALFVPYEHAKTLANLKAKNFWGSTVSIKAAEGIDIEDLKDEATGILRAYRKLKPKEETNFSLNELTMLSSVLDSFFGVLNMAGLFIGIFAIIVGMFSVANIMFVSVKERTNIIGIKKALGAKRYIILLEFLIESIILCILGGIMGLILVYGIINILSAAIGFEMVLSNNNIFLGVIISVVVGIISGVIPAWQAARMDPVVAIRK